MNKLAGFDLPADFPSQLHETLWQRSLGKAQALGMSHDWWQPHVTGSWLGIAYRFAACSEHDEKFTELIGPHVIVPEMVQQRQYEVSRELFEFCFSALSTLECLAYALYADASMIKPTQFPLRTGKDAKKVDLKTTVELLRSAFSTDKLGNTLKTVIDAAQYDVLDTNRNVLSHRGAMGHTIHWDIEESLYLGTTKEATWLELWSTKLRLDTTTTRDMRSWLAESVRIVLQDTEQFMTAHF